MLLRGCLSTLSHGRCIDRPHLAGIAPEPFSLPNLVWRALSSSRPPPLRVLSQRYYSPSRPRPLLPYIPSREPMKASLVWTAWRTSSLTRHHSTPAFSSPAVCPSCWTTGALSQTPSVPGICCHQLPLPIAVLASRISTNATRSISTAWTPSRAASNPARVLRISYSLDVYLMGSFLPPQQSQ